MTEYEKQKQAVAQSQTTPGADSSAKPTQQYRPESIAMAKELVKNLNRNVMAEDQFAAQPKKQPKPKV
jgi:hypothetical protein